MKIFDVLYREEPGGWWAESEDIPGWSAAAESWGRLRELIKPGIAFALEIGEDDFLVHETLPEGWRYVSDDIIAKTGGRS